MTGAPQADWLAITGFAVSQLDNLESGEVALEDLSLSVSGLAKSPDTYASLATGLMADLPYGITFESAAVDPAFVDDFGFNASRVDGATLLTGYVPGDVMRTMVGEVTDATTKGLLIAQDAPDSFAPSLEYGLELLNHLSTGELRVDDSGLAISDIAASRDDFEAVTSMISMGTPAGVNLNIADISPILASPYIWSVRKRADGALTIRGNVPDEITRDAILRRAGDAAIDHMQISSRAPEYFYEDSLVAVSAIASLETGRVGYTGENWFLTGQPATDEASISASGALITARTPARSWFVDLKDVPAPLRLSRH